MSKKYTTTRGGGGTSHPSSSKASTSSDKNIHLSKSLTWILRHGAVQEKLPVSGDGFIDVLLILRNPRFTQYTIDDIRKTVETNDKQRFALRNDPKTGILQIRANQGHSIEVKNLALTPITDPTKYPEVIHGTYFKHLESIKRSGLSKMNRNHIHFAPGKPGADGVISGMRTSAEVLIYVNLQKAMEDGIEFFLSENNVILSPGNPNGILDIKYFSAVINRKTGQKMDT